MIPNPGMPLLIDAWTVNRGASKGIPIASYFVGLSMNHAQLSRPHGIDIHVPGVRAEWRDSALEFKRQTDTGVPAGMASKNVNKCEQ